jgi:hypothetical protein
MKTEQLRGAAVIEDAIRTTIKGTRPIWRTLLALLALAAAVLLALSYNPAEAATTFIVTETGDDGDNNIDDARCDTDAATGRQCTLRAAIEEANDTDGADTIDFGIESSASVTTISSLSLFASHHHRHRYHRWLHPGGRQP